MDSEPVAEERADQPGAGDEPTSETEAEAAPETDTETETKSESEPVVTEESAEESAIEENVSAEPVAGTASEDTASEAPAAEETASEEPATEAEPAVEEPVAEEPAPEVAEEEESQAPQPEPEAEAAAEPEPEPEPAPEPAAAEVTPAPEPVAEVVADSEPETVVEPTAEPETVVEPTAEPETVVEPTAEPEPEAEVEPVAVVVPAAAGGEDAPQGSPAVDDESGTGGAGGQEEDVPAALRSAYDAAGATLAAHELTGTTARTYLVLDRSASMRAYYKDGSAQALGEQTLALAAHLDPESTVHVIFFSTELDGTGELTLTEHENKIDDLHAGLGRMGRTSYHAAVEEVLAQHTKHAPDAPALVVFQTDGAPDAKTPATQALTDAAKSHPAVFFSFVAFGDPENKAFDYLRKLKLPNTSHFLAGETPKELTDAEVYEGILANWRP
ncbi:VWA domain-containing protein [Streptomyces griseorubiginosus]|uniref:VWA domain-containing protein n=1 Tax=Streptomyces griseorubiginosus TaxID=67304 RepID=UPI0036EAB60E